MGKYEEVAAVVLEALSHRETVKVMDDQTKEELGFLSSQSCFFIYTEYLDPEGVSKDIIFNLVLPKSFPLVLPKIYIEKSKLEEYKNLPHVNLTSGNICTFDEETVRPDPHDPVGIVLTCLSRAKEIVEAGLNGLNFKDYEDEFMTYWLSQYNGEPKIQAETLCLFSGEPDSAKLEMIKLNKVIETYEYVLHQNDEDARQFLSYLKVKEVTYTVVPNCHLGSIPFNFVPPFDRKNKDIKRLVSLLPAQVISKFKSYINSKSSPKFVTATISLNGTQHLIGWKHSAFNMVGRRNGFRKDKTNNYELLSSLQANDFVTRCYFGVYSTLQKHIRTDGHVTQEPGKRLLISGLGSIGSNLAYFLNSDTNTNFTLVDPDFISMDNLNRHLLGFESLWKNKAKAVHDYLLNKNPLQKVTFFQASIVSIVEHGRKLLEEIDYLFMVTGKANIDEYMASICQLEDLNKPLFILWVEPYLCAGHCLFLHPEDRRYKDFFDEEDFFLNNVIDKTSYEQNHPLLSLRQSGCHTSYVPYGQNAVTHFLGAMYPEISNIVNIGSKTSKAITWVGDLQYVKDLGIKISAKALDLNKGAIIEHNGTI